jgi:copper(I)-binding protein
MRKTLTAAALAVIIASPALAGDIEVSAPFMRASPKIANAAAGFMVLHNKGKAADRLVAATADVSKTVELHTTIKEGDIMKMRHVPAIEVPAGGSVELKPGSYHVMFMNLHKPLPEGTEVPVTLRFEKAGALTVKLPVRPLTAMDAGMGQMNHGSAKH